MFKMTRSSAGMSLVEVMVSVSILTVIMLGMTTMMKNAGKSSKDLEKRSDIEGMMQMITLHMADKDNCSATVRGAAGATAGDVTRLSGFYRINSNGQYEADPRLRVQSIAAGDTRSAPVINGLALVYNSNNNFDLVVTFVKNPAAAGGRANSQVNTMQNVVTRRIPLNLDSCSRTFGYGQGNGSPTCATGTPIGQTISITSAGPAGNFGNNFNLVVCQNCATRGTVHGCL
jgi:Tfp pilus assembly protein PilV